MGDPTVAESSADHASVRGRGRGRGASPPARLPVGRQPLRQRQRTVACTRGDHRHWKMCRRGPKAPLQRVIA